MRLTDYTKSKTLAHGFSSGADSDFQFLHRGGQRRSVAADNGRKSKPSDGYCAEEAVGWGDSRHRQVVTLNKK
jgi:hypothetical protein